MKKEMLLTTGLLMGMALPVNGTVYAEENTGPIPSETTITESNSTKTNVDNTEEATKTEEKPVLTPLPIPKPMETTVINDGKLYKGRTLLPLRAISEGLGLDVKWNQKKKQVTITDGYIYVVMTQDSNKIQIDDRTVTIDVPVKIFKGKTYVPIAAAVPNNNNAHVSWNNHTKVATITLGNKEVIVSTGKNKVENKLPEVNELTHTRISTLLKKATDISIISFINQKQDYFRPYFTQKFMSLVVSQEGLPHDKDGKIATAFMYVSDYTKEEFNVEGKKTIVVTQVIPNWNGTKVNMQKRVRIVKDNGVWKVDYVEYPRTEQNL
ncbi:copper amine oxidase N-terminal domain-containing protein [Lysinibacillus yapensis]|uniref:Copper amine oxidase N-terminal domain-containing protein n=1 Tax=Ureibacillus yapensis TaxID=2304605 RepID=A0A396SB26_9BACL|nr:copper amine oxidase N-terminal domain-containing protein [Lysinibacillus yapensis]RHW38332.1 copper amine oxidase N-terminal domain-containing protein [Lysinibacillus yapensis]